MNNWEPDILKQFNQTVIFEKVVIGQTFIEALSPFNHVFTRCNDLIESGRSVNGRRMSRGRVLYKRFSDWEPVFVESGSDG